MSKRGTIATIAVLVAFAAFLLVSTLSSQRAECTVVVDYGGGRDSATASAETVEAAEAQAQTTACGTLADGMNDRIACANTPPVRRACRAT